MRQFRASSTNPYPNVSFHKPSGLWVAKKTIRGRTQAFGYHATPELARDALEQAGHGQVTQTFSSLTLTVAEITGMSGAAVDDVLGVLAPRGLSIVPVTIPAEHQHAFTSLGVSQIVWSVLVDLVKQR